MSDTSLKSKGESIVCKFFESKKNANCLLELEELLLSPDEECVLAMFPVVFDLFSKVYSTKMLSSSSNDGGANAKFKSWLKSRYEDFISHLLTYLSHKTADIQIEALETLVSFLKLEGEHPSVNEKENPNFPFFLFMKIVSGLASDCLEQGHLIEDFKKYTKYHDIKLHLFKLVQKLLSESTKVSEVFLENCVLLLCSVKFPKSFGKSANTFAYRSGTQHPFQLKEKVFRKIFTSVWTNILSCELPPNCMVKLLPVFTENVLPHLQNPCLMTDFLTNAYNKGGKNGLLALKGLYFLMDKYNLEYPDFYVKLYALVDKDIMDGPYSSNFFFLTDLFLSSTHLPAHIIAAFAKKLGRASLTCSTRCVLKVLRLISNLFANHPSLKVLVHRVDDQVLEKDPFYMDIKDPAKSIAMESSLWELQALRYHINPDVCWRAKELLNDTPKLSLSMLEIAKTSAHDLYIKSRKRKFSEVPLAVYKPVKQGKSS